METGRRTSASALFSGLFLPRLLSNRNACPNNRIPNEAFRNYGLRRDLNSSFCDEAKMLRVEL